MARLTWHQREQLLLEAIRDLEDELLGQLQNMHLTEHTGLGATDVALGLQALLDGDFIAGGDISSAEDPPGSAQLLGIRLRPAGRVHVRQWPGDDAAAALLEVLDDAIERTDDPEQRGALEQTRRGLKGLAGKVLTEVAVGYAKRVSGLDA